MSLFCRHNRFTADCPICAKGTVLDPDISSRRRRPAASRTATSGRRGKRPAPPPGAARVTRGPYSSAGPYMREDEHDSYEVRLEKVPGGVRLGSWAGGGLERRAPVLGMDDVAALVLDADERELLPERDRAGLVRALEAEPVPGPEDPPFGSSAGRSGELREELRVERHGDDLVRIARWIYRPGPSEWELQEAPPMLPAARFAEALESAVRRGVFEAT
ncbi:MAG: hypothetical protein WD844_12115 [Thermoleophilaceae bacterium]